MTSRFGSVKGEGVATDAITGCVGVDGGEFSEGKAGTDWAAIPIDSKSKVITARMVPPPTE
jgi:hypothetical protein